MIQTHVLFYHNEQHMFMRVENIRNIVQHVRRTMTIAVPSPIHCHIVAQNVLPNVD